MKKIVGMILISVTAISLFSSSYTSQLHPDASDEANELGGLIEAKQYTDALTVAQRSPELTYPRQGHNFQTALEQLLSQINSTQTPLSDEYKVLTAFLVETAQKKRYHNGGLFTLFLMRNNKNPQALDLFRYLVESDLINCSETSAESGSYLHGISNPKIISTLIATGANPDTPNSNGVNALEMALLNSISRNDRAPYLDRATAERVVEQLYFWTRFEHKTEDEITAIKERISTLFGPQFLNKLLNTPREVLHANRHGIDLSNTLVHLEDRTVTLRGTGTVTWPTAMTKLILEIAGVPRI